MTIFSHEQAVVFNRVRYTSMKRQKIAVARTQQQTEIDDLQATVKKVTNEMTEMQEDVVQGQKVVARQQEKLAREEAEVAQEREVIAQEQAKIIQEQKAITEGLEKIAREQKEISREEAKIAYEQEVIAQEQVEIIQKEVAITEGLEKIAREQSAILKVNGTITELSTMDAGLQAEVLNSLDSLDEYGALKPVLLQFDSVSKTIFWGEDGSVQLTKQQYIIVETIYHAPRCRISITSLDERAWGMEKMPTDSAAKAAISRLNKELKVADFPFEVLRIKRELKTVSVIHPVEKVVLMNVTAQPEIEMYELIRR